MVGHFQSILDKPARLIIRLLFGFASDSVFDKLNQSTNTEAAMLSNPYHPVKYRVVFLQSKLILQKCLNFLLSLHLNSNQARDRKYIFFWQILSQSEFIHFSKFQGSIKRSLAGEEEAQLNFGREDKEECGFGGMIWYFCNI